MLTPEFLKLSSKLGKDHMLVQGAGGNTSIKQNNKMWIKASGTWLSKSLEENIFVEVNLERIRKNILLNEDISAETSNKTNKNLRPSIETSLHALMPHKIVVHTHPIEILSWLVRKDAKEQLFKILKSKTVAWVPYNRPGKDLSQALKKSLEQKAADVILLGNHGLVVGANTCLEISTQMKNLLLSCKQKSNPFIKPLNDLTEIAKDMNMRLPSYKEIHSLALNEDAYRRCKEKNGILYPDQAVFLGSKMPCVEFDKSLKKVSKTSFLIIRGKGVLVSKMASKDVDIMLRCHAQLLSRIAPESELNYLTKLNVQKLLHWEPEKYRLRQRKIKKSI